MTDAARKDLRTRLLGREWNVRRVIAAKKSMKPDIIVAESQGEFIVAKDFRDKIWVIRRLWGPLNIMYEKFILQKLIGVSGIPAFIGLEDYNCMLISYIDGDEIKKLSHRLAPGYFDNLLKIAADIHAKGILHLDLGHKTNVMVRQNGEPAIIDFNTAVYLPKNFIFSPLLRLLAKIDNLSILRLKIRFTPEDTDFRERTRVKKFLRLRKLWIFDKLSRRITNMTKDTNKTSSSS
jgi:predicted Ser/Thr protein kinase